MSLTIPCCIQTGEHSICGREATPHHICDTAAGPMVECLCPEHAAMLDADARYWRQQREAWEAQEAQEARKPSRRLLQCLQNWLRRGRREAVE